MMDKILLAIGDESDILLNKYFKRNIDILENKKIDTKIVSYQQLLDKPEIINDIESESVIVLFFFPYNYWNSNIETGGEIYGNKRMGERFEELFNKLGSDITFRHKCKVSYVNNPFSITLVRDKKRSHDVLKQNNVSSPKAYRNKTSSDLIELAEHGTDLFLKVRYGSLGKGISYISKNKWFSNFKYQNSKLMNYPTDRGWKMVKISKDIHFLEQLLENDVHIEEEIKTPIIDNKKFDLRVYVVYQEPMLVYAKTAEINQIITNWYQGGKIEPLPFLEKIPKKAIELAKEEAVKAASAFGLNYSGIDVILSKEYEQAFVLEGNAFPGVPHPEIPNTVFDPMKSLLEKI